MKTQQIKHFSKAELAYKLDCLMSEVKANVKEHILVKFKEHGINVSFEMLELMGCLRKNEGTGPQEIADLTLRDRSVIIYLAGKLAERNMVTIASDDQLIYLTQEGLDLKEQSQSMVAETYEKVAEELEMKELQDCIIVLDKISYNLVTL